VRGKSSTNIWIRKMSEMKNTKYKIAYCTWTDPRDKRSWSGNHYFIMKTLSEIEDIDVLGPLTNKWFYLVKIIEEFVNIILKKKISVVHTTVVAKKYAKQLKKKLKGKEYDFLFVPAGSELIAYLKTDISIIYLSDATFASMVDYYPEFSNLLPISRRMGLEIERRAIENSFHIIYSSDWAANSAMESYGCPKEKISVIPFGANIENIPLKEDILKIRNEPIKKIKLLWVGVDWERKGGQIAYKTMVELNKRGIDTELIVCGCTPPKGNSHKGLRYEGFLNKNIPGQLNKLQQLYKESNIFILPTKQECAGIVFAEASAYGLPILSFDTGGVSNYVEDNFNGYCLDLEATEDDFVEKVEMLVKDLELYRRIAENCREKFERELNWNSWKERVKVIFY
jgi:glycosyltransferase involved in cell wall biosynthesis